MIGMMKLVRRIFILCITVLLILFIVRRTTLFPSLRNFFKPKEIVVDQTPLVLTQLKNIAQLMTVEAYNEVVVDSTRYPLGMPPAILKRLPLNPLSFFGVSQLVLIVRGKVVAGVDLQTFSKAHIRFSSDSLFIRLPRATVLDVITNPSDVETFVEKGTWDVGAATALKRKAQVRLVQQALAQGALQQADAKARQLVYELLKNAGYKTVIVTTALQLSNPSGKQ